MYKLERGSLFYLIILFKKVIPHFVPRICYQSSSVATAHAALIQSINALPYDSCASIPR